MKRQQLNDKKVTIEKKNSPETLGASEKKNTPETSIQEAKKRSGEHGLFRKQRKTKNTRQSAPATRKNEGNEGERGIRTSQRLLDLNEPSRKNTKKV